MDPNYTYVPNVGALRESCGPTTCPPRDLNAKQHANGRFSRFSAVTGGVIMAGKLTCGAILLLGMAAVVTVRGQYDDYDFGSEERRVPRVVS